MYCPVIVSRITSLGESCTLSSYSPCHHVEGPAKQTSWAASLLGAYMCFNHRNIGQGKLINS